MDPMGVWSTLGFANRDVEWRGLAVLGSLACHSFSRNTYLLVCFRWRLKEQRRQPLAGRRSLPMALEPYLKLEFQQHSRILLSRKTMQRHTVEESEASPGKRQCVRDAVGAFCRVVFARLLLTRVCPLLPMKLKAMNIYVLRLIPWRPLGPYIYIGNWG